MSKKAEREVSKALDNPKTQERFWKKLAPPDENGCRVWLGNVSSPSQSAPSNKVRGRKRRYIPQPCGRFAVGGHNPRAPRVALYLSEGKWGEQALHSCDNPLCCNPAHLHWGSASDNMEEARERGRAMFFGQPCNAPKSKLPSPARKTTA